MRSRGFTLIELLAVIVILAIIALIALPIVIHIIDDSKKSSEKESIKLYLDTVEKMIAKQNLKSKYEPDLCTITSGDIMCQSNDEDIYVEGTNKTLKIEMKGDTPTNGTIYFTNGKITTGENIFLNGLYYQITNGNISDGTKDPVDILSGVISRIQTAAGSFTGTCEITNATTMVCGNDTKALTQSGHKVTEGVITFNNGEVTSYKNLKMEGKYYHNKNGTTSNTAEKQYLCTKVTAASTTSITKGDKYTCKVKSDMTTPYTFYVLTEPVDGKVNLIMDRNICNDGTISYTSGNNYCRYKWYSSANNNTYGPTTVMAELYAGTKDWDNVEDMIMNYTDENNGAAEDKGYTSIITSNGVTTITGKPTTNTTTVGTSSKPLKARLPKESEVTGAGCTTGAGSCPTWLMEYMTYYNVSNDKYSMNNNSEAYQNQIYGYWLLSSYPGNSNCARSVYYYGSVNYNFTTYGYFGARPVITVSTSDLSS